MSQNPEYEVGDKVTVLMSGKYYWAEVVRVRPRADGFAYALALRGGREITVTAEAIQPRGPRPGASPPGAKPGTPKPKGGE